MARGPIPLCPETDQLAAKAKLRVVPFVDPETHQVVVGMATAEGEPPPVWHVGPFRFALKLIRWRPRPSSVWCLLLIRKRTRSSLAWRRPKGSLHPYGTWAHSALP